MSSKLHIINHVALEQLQQSSSGAGANAKSKTNVNAAKPIRNAKYKKTHGADGGGFNLLNFLIHKPRTTQREQRKLRTKTKCVSAAAANATGAAAHKKTQLKKRRGKIREGGRKKQLSRLKKSILCYRKQKRLQDNLNTAIVQLETLSLSQTQTLPVAVSGVHSRRFRAYCNNCTTPLLSQLTEKLLRELDRFQRRAYSQNEIKARAHRRFVVGFREVQNFLRINKVKLAIIAPDCEEARGEAGLDATISTIKAQCEEQQVPYAFALQRRQLAYVFYKKVPISCVGVLDYDGARDIYAQLLEALQKARQDFEVLLGKQTKPTADLHIEEING